jgi:hypothetical protein
MKIQVAIQTHFFQQRLCWMLSSMVQQNNMPDDVELSASIAYVKGLGDPTTEAVIDLFRKEGLDIHAVPYKDQSEFQYRGWTRNRQLEETDADWIIFADSDMVYPTNFFSLLAGKLKKDYKDNPHCLYSRRFSTTLKETKAVVESYLYPYNVPAPHTQASELPGKLRGNVGAGYFQMANVKLLKKNHGYYQIPGKKIDWSWEKRQKAKSDMHFRKMLGREAIDLPVQIHLQHERDSDFGEHVEVQR